jgi:hypothetical protein
MDALRANMVGFDFTPPIHPEYGAWGTTPGMTELDMPLLGRCLALAQGDTMVLWFGMDLCGNPPNETDEIRAEIVSALELDSIEQVLWSTSQTHSSPTFPGSSMSGGSTIAERGNYDSDYTAEQRRIFIKRCVDAAREAIGGLQPAQVMTGRGHCDSVSYNTRFPMPNGGVKFSRHHLEGLQSGKFFDPTIELVVFEDAGGQTIGAIFNFCSHPATMINDKYISPDWVGTARAEIEAALDGAPAMFVQGFCGDVNCHHLFGTPAQAKATGKRLGQAAVAALPTLVPARGTPLVCAFEDLELSCRPMYTHEELDAAIGAREAYAESLAWDPTATWVDGINFPEQMTADENRKNAELQLKYLYEVKRMLDAGESLPGHLVLSIGALRIGDVGAAFSCGENFTMTGMQVRLRSPFVHTLVCGDTNGLFGYIGDDAEIDRGGYETDSFWKMHMPDRPPRLAPARGTVDRIVNACTRLLQQLQTS